jgi:hypothetical protein
MIDIKSTVHDISVSHFTPKTQYNKSNKRFV